MKPRLIWVIFILFFVIRALPALADETTDIPVNVLGSSKEILAEAQKTWRKDAYITNISLSLSGDGNGHVQNYLVFTLYSPSKKIAEFVPRGQPYGDYPSTFKAGDYVEMSPIPDFKIDLPEAIQIARKNGLTGKLENAYLRVLKPKDKPPILAWVVQTDDPLDGNLHSKVPAIDAYTGDVIPFNKAFDPPSGSDAELAAAARNFWRALHGHFGGGGGGGSAPFEFGGGYVSPSGQVDNGYDAAAHDRAVLLDNAYWNGGPDAYNRAQNGESSWGEQCAYGGC